MNAELDKLAPVLERREMAERHADGLTVRLLFEPATRRVLVEVFDLAAGAVDVWQVPNDSALDALAHPFRYEPS